LAGLGLLGARLSAPREQPSYRTSLAALREMSHHRARLAAPLDHPGQRAMSSGAARSSTTDRERRSALKAIAA